MTVSGRWVPLSVGTLILGRLIVGWLAGVVHDPWLIFLLLLFVTIQHHYLRYSKQLSSMRSWLKVPCLRNLGSSSHLCCLWHRADGLGAAFTCAPMLVSNVVVVQGCAWVGCGGGNTSWAAPPPPPPMGIRPSALPIAITHALQLLM